jgi:ATP-dependent RNA helicase
MAAVKSSGRNAAFEDLSNVEFETSEDVEVIDQFKNMHLKEELLRGVFAYGKKCRRNLGQQMRL